MVYLPQVITITNWATRFIANMLPISQTVSLLITVVQQSKIEA